MTLKALKRRWRLGRARADVAARLRQPPPVRTHGLPRPLVVSLTSYPARYPTLGLTLSTLLTQRVRPDATILWLGEGHADRLPEEVLALRSRGLEVRETRDLRSFTKIAPALLAFAEANIVTADDDLYYEDGWLESLVEAARAAPSDVIARRAHRIALQDGRPLPYAEWEWSLRRAMRGPLVFPTGVAGVLYPPGSLHEEASRDDVFLDLCPTSDDVWLWWMHRLAGATANKIGGRPRLLEWPGSQEVNLRQGNLREPGNDRAVAAMMRRYGLPLSDSDRKA
jgi:hypothetical protein